MKSKRGFEIKSLVVSFIVIAVCEAFFILDVVADAFYIDIQTSWVDHSALELVITVILALAMFVIGREINRLLHEHRDAQANIQVASGELIQVIETKFSDWQLTLSERDFAMLLIKGLSNREIADIRATRPGTVKSQSSSIYQKADVKNRHELAAYFVEDLLAGERLLQDDKPST
jgi:DNA-binding CsgD family transcriptional regulator